MTPLSRKNCCLLLSGIGCVVIIAVNISLYFLTIFILNESYSLDNCYTIHNSTLFDSDHPGVCNLKVENVEYPFYFDCNKYPPSFECTFDCDNACTLQSCLSCKVNTRADKLENDRVGIVIIYLFVTVGFLACLWFCYASAESLIEKEYV